MAWFGRLREEAILRRECGGRKIQPIQPLAFPYRIRIEVEQSHPKLGREVTPERVELLLDIAGVANLVCAPA